MDLADPAVADLDLQVQDLPLRQNPGSLEKLEDIARLEKKTFPASEAYDFSSKLLKQASARIFVVHVQSHAKPVLAGYAFTVNHRGNLLLHKVCVAAMYRRKGVGRLLVNTVCDYGQTASCVGVQLWVASSNQAARSLYASCGFEDVCVVQNYYSHSRNGGQMIKSLQVVI